MEFLLVIILVALVVAGVAFVGIRTRGRSEMELPPPPVDVAATPTDVDQAPAPVELADEPRLEVAPPRFRDRLGKARDLLGGYVTAVLSRSGIDESTWSDLEEALIRADVGIDGATAILGELRAQVKDQGVTDPAAVVELLKADLTASMAGRDRSLRYEPGSPNVWLFVGVNGVGKTTSIGKIARQQTDAGRKVIMAAGDTFRAAAVDQLATWADRTGTDIVRGTEGGDPSSVIYDGVQAAAARGHDIVLADTAGRLHTKTNLMEELRKVRRVADKPPGRVTEVLLVLDATTGQNGLVQAREFLEAVEVTGVVLTKLDGTAKGGIAMAIERELGIPVKLVGLGEQVEDLVEFDPAEFVEALFS